MPDPRDAKRQVIEALLENEALTDGLTDAEARVINQWCLDRVNMFAPTSEQSLEDYGRVLARQARMICRITSHIQAADERDRLERLLHRLTNDTAQQTAFLHLLDQHRPLQDYLQILCRMAEGSTYA